MNTKKERIAYFQTLVDQGLNLDQIKADKEVSSWGLAESTIQRYCIECDYVEEIPEPETPPEENKSEGEAINPELNSDKIKPLPKPLEIKLPVFDENSENIQLERCLKLHENIITIYTKLIELRLMAKKSTTRLVGLRRKANEHVKQIRKFNKG